MSTATVPVDLAELARVSADSMRLQNAKRALRSYMRAMETLPGLDDDLDKNDRYQGYKIALSLLETGGLPT